MNPWVLLGLVAAWVASAGGAFLYGADVGQARCKADRADREALVRETREAANQAAAAAIAQLRIVNTTIRQEVQREVRTDVVYRDCKLPAGGLRIANDALAGKPPQPAGGGELPRADTDGGRR